MIHTALVLVLALSSQWASLDMRKCGPSADAIYLSEALLWVVDGVVLAELPTTPTGEAVPVWLPSTEEIERSDLRCWEWTEETTGERVRQTVISITTKRGLPDLVATRLNALAEAQERFRAEHGRYASQLTELGFSAARITLPIGLATVPGGWNASVDLRADARRCYVFGGSAEVRLGAGLEAGVPRCLAEDSGLPPE